MKIVCGRSVPDLCSPYSTGGWKPTNCILLIPLPTVSQKESVSWETGERKNFFCFVLFFPFCFRQYMQQQWWHLQAREALVPVFSCINRAVSSSVPQTSRGSVSLSSSATRTWVLGSKEVTTSRSPSYFSCPSDIFVANSRVISLPG